jgi:acetylornithine aminotransferase/acetylornithine/N-succinyldiaminopimelate aminotransferase
MLSRKIIINRTHDNVLRFLPPYIIGKQHVDEMVSALADVLRQGSVGLSAASGRQENQRG